MQFLNDSESRTNASSKLNRLVKVAFVSLLCDTSQIKTVCLKSLIMQLSIIFSTKDSVGEQSYRECTLHDTVQEAKCKIISK